MKVFTNLYIYLLVFSLISCRETSGAKLENNEQLDKKEVIKKEPDSLDQLKQATEELDNQLNELDKAINDLNNN